MGETETLVGTTLQDTYRVERLVGEGGMGAVYEASHMRLPRRFAIKVLYREVATQEEALARFRHEAEITSAIGHPHILEVIDFNLLPDGSPYILMEFLDGEDLGAVIQRRGRLELPLATAIFCQVASALQAVHERGIIHRDLKPQNIFVCRHADRDDYIKVVDFGISKVAGSRSVVTRTHVLMGTPNYMSPEQAEQRAAAVDPRTDIFSLGTIAYQMLTGVIPFTGDSIPSILYRIVHGEPEPLQRLRPDLPPGVARVIARAMAKRPEDRYPTVDAFSEDFLEAAALDPDLAGRRGAFLPQKTGPFFLPPPTLDPALASASDPDHAGASDPDHAGAADPVRTDTATGEEALTGGGVAAAWPTEASEPVSTLAASSGELTRGPGDSLLEARLPVRRGPALLAGAVAVVLVLGLGVLFLSGRGARDPRPLPADAPGAAGAPTAGPVALPGPEIVRQEQPAVVHALTVKADAPGVVCRLSLDRGPVQTSPAPCSFQVAQGQRVHLQAVKGGHHPFRQEWIVRAPRELTLQVLDGPARIVLAGGEVVPPTGAGAGEAGGAAATEPGMAGATTAGTSGEDSAARPREKKIGDEEVGEGVMSEW